MSDPHNPSLTSFAFTSEETTAITVALAHSDPWDHDAKELASVADVLKAVKNRLRELHMNRQKNTCCYCRMILAGGGRFVIDREHILPKSRYGRLTFSPANLSVACKRCNMEYKVDKIDFTVDPATIEVAYTDPSRYLLVHPNFDVWEQHLERLVAQANQHQLVKYTVLNGSTKGSYTYQYFRLDLLEVDTFDRGQGGDGLKPEVEHLRRELASLTGAEIP